jgi:aryl-alcohol dehydrogenase-like predicted oxidoreductase
MVPWYVSLACTQGPRQLTLIFLQCGGFLSDKWLYAPEPNRYHEEPTLRDPLTPSQKKYLDVILSAWGTWSLFQQLLSVLRIIGDYHGGVSIANVATRWVLDHDFVGAVIIGESLVITTLPSPG